MSAAGMTQGMVSESVSGGVLLAADWETMAATAPEAIALGQKSPPSTLVPGIPKNRSPGLQAWELVAKPVISMSKAG